MAALDLTASQYPFKTARASLEAVSGNVREVKLPKWCRVFTIVFKTSANADDSGRVASSGTDTSAIGDDVFPVPSGSALEIPIAPSGAARSIYVTGDAGGGYGYILLQAAE
jgi:hypothetical protein